MDVLPKLGSIVECTISSGSVHAGHFGLVKSALNDDDTMGKGILVAFHDCELTLFSHQFIIKKHLTVNHFVCSVISWKVIKEGDIGLVVGISTKSPNRDRVAIDFGHGVVINMLDNQIRNAPNVWRSPGSIVYSLIDHGQIKKGDRGTIVGTSTRPEARDRVAVKFGVLDPRAYNFHATMATMDPPNPPAKATFSMGAMSEALPSLATEDVTLISHVHGRARREERKILRIELQAAIKHGVRERANPGRDGSTRWRYTHDGVVYITDETSRHEVTSWRIDEKDADVVEPAELELDGRGCHAVLIVDSSGSMRTSDVPGYKSRADAVYDCLARQFVKEQIKHGAGDDVVVSLISMGDEAKVLIHGHPLDESLIAPLQKIGRRRPRSHGNYIPALDKALEIMTADAANRARMLLLFFSDGAPSDQVMMECRHGIRVFDIDHREDPLMQHGSKGAAWACRRKVVEEVQRECLDRVKRLGQVFGRENVILRTLAFGPPNEDFRLLEDLANALPRGEFQKLGLDASKLKTAFSSLSSSMTDLRTEGGGCLLTPRLDKVVNKQQKIDISSSIVKESDGWWIYSHDYFLGKYEFHKKSGKLKNIMLIGGATGLAFVSQPFAEGAERLVYRCTEIAVLDYVAARSDEFPHEATRHGLRLVAKEAKVVENLHRGRSFHERFARVQVDAAELAVQFNDKLPIPRPEWKVSFVPTHIYGCVDNAYKDNKAWVLVEPELDGKFTKWNNNAGAVLAGSTGVPSARAQGTGIGSTLGMGMAMLEEEEDEEEEDEAVAPIEQSDIPQAFSHFTYEQSMGSQLVCDLQGVWNPEDGFQLTDPVVHHVCSDGKKHRNGATDKGLEGVKKFFTTHKCNGLCSRMGLQIRSSDNLIKSKK